MKRNIKLTLEYDGTHYVGWQRQAEGRSIQGEIEAVLRNIMLQPCDVVGAGRTDAGVHARGQVANFRTDSVMETGKILSALNGLLPEDIVVKDAAEVPMEFHARFSAKERIYSYLIVREPTALSRFYSWHLKYQLDPDLLRTAAGCIDGTHDFSAFAKANSEIDCRECTVTQSDWKIEGSTLRYEIGANRFVHGMVRALVGTMVDVARGYMPIEDFQALFAKKDRSEAGTTAPARGLVLEQVVY
jgi:tRNA pseudouridine38-40 synthase